MTIKAADKTTRYGTVAAYGWTGQGWVNGDTDTTIGTAPTCQATIQGAAASVTTNPGAYLGAITCAGAADANYTIGYASGKLTVNPVIRLSQTGLPATVPQRAVIDGQPINLPTGEVELGYGTTHSYAFPGAVTDPNGVVYLTTTPGFNGPVTTNATVNATYTTMTNIVDTAAASGGIDAQPGQPPEDQVERPCRTTCAPATSKRPAPPCTTSPPWSARSRARRSRSPPPTP